MGKKILILTASPQRDKVVDELLAEELKKKGHEVHVRPCLREGRRAVLDIQPNVVVVPPIRNVYSRDFVEQLKKWRCGVVSRHTEPSCDWQDFKKLDQKQKVQILSAYPYMVDMELVWSQDEAEILNRRGFPFRAFPIGAVAVDVYLRKDIIAERRHKKPFNEKYKFSGKKKTLLIASPWGFADSAPDLQIDETKEAKLDLEGRDRHLKMIREVHKALKDKWNILVSVHPGVVDEPYKKLCAELDIPLDTESTSFNLIIHSDALIHAGSTMAINAHSLNIPAYQFGDVNTKDSNSWWGLPESSISKVSPYYKTAKALIGALKLYKKHSNADKAILKVLEKGRYGLMDGKATARAAEFVNKINGEFTMCWPDNTRDYSQITVLRSAEQIISPVHCGVCNKNYFLVNESWLEQMKNFTGMTKPVVPKHATCCPHCGARFFKKV